MEIQVGEFVRTKDGYIGRYIQDAPVNNKVLEIDNNEIIFATEYNNIVKHSFNIIDLIEVGDYVNGYKVLDVVEDLETGELHLEMQMDYTNKELGDCTIYNKDILSIVTHEEFASVEYKVKE